MNWLSFFIGVLVGWIVEWLIDLFYWRRKWQSVLQEKETCQTNLDRARAQIRLLEAENRDLESWYKRTSGANVTMEKASASLRGGVVDVDLETSEVALPDVDLGVDLEAPEVDESRLSLAALFDGLKARFPDIDLDRSIAGLKAKFPDLDVKTAIDGLKIDFPDLDIDAALQDLKARLSRLGTGVALGGTGADVADRFTAVPAVAPLERDDLKRIEGIGPKIAQLLADHGIRTFAQLAATSTDRLSSILEQAGPNYRLADPTSWPEQAGLAADGAWDELQALQDRLLGGRRAQRRGG